MKTLRHALIAICVFSIIACQPVRQTLNLATSAEIQFIAESNTNPDNDQRPSPVVIRAFQLADDRQFNREDFLNLYESAEERLGRDLINTTILKELTPQESRTEHFDLSPEIKYIGLLAEFIQYQDANAILVLPITPHKKNSFTVHIDKTSITLAQK